MLCGTPMDDVVDFLIEPGYIAQGLEELHVAWWDPIPLLTELKALRVKSILQTASDSLLLFDIRLGGVDLDPPEASKAIGAPLHYTAFTAETHGHPARRTRPQSQYQPQRAPPHPPQPHSPARTQPRPPLHMAAHPSHNSQIQGARVPHHRVRHP